MTAYNTIRDGWRVSHRRQQPSGDWAWCASRTDTSPLAGDSLYTESCSLCYLNQSHSLDLHNQKVVEWNMRLAS